MNLRKSNMDGKVRTSIHEEIEKIEKIKGSYVSNWLNLRKIKGEITQTKAEEKYKSSKEKK